MHVQQNSSIIEKKICSEPDFNITSLNAETVYGISIMPAIVKGNGSSFSFSLNTSRTGEYYCYNCAVNTHSVSDKSFEQSVLKYLIVMFK